MRDSTQHADLFKATRCKEIAGYTSPDATAPFREGWNKLIGEEVVKKALVEITLKSGMPDRTLLGGGKHLHTSPFGEFTIGGPEGEAGLTGRKVIIDTYGGRCPWWRRFLWQGSDQGLQVRRLHRQADGKSVVDSGLCKRALGQLSNAIGVAKPWSMFVAA